MTIIPAIDIMNGQCVRLTEGDFSQQTTYQLPPAAMAAEFENQGFTRLHVVDLDGARAGKPINLATIEAIREKTNLQIDAGGGIRSAQDLETLFELGIEQINIGSIAVREPRLVRSWVQQFGGERFILSADVRKERVASEGWQRQGQRDVYEFIDTFLAWGILEVTCTDISTDGKLQGPNLGLYDKILDRFPGLLLNASGGVSNLEDLRNLRTLGCSGVIVGKAIYEQTIDLKTLAESC